MTDNARPRPASTISLPRRRFAWLDRYIRHPGLMIGVVTLLLLVIVAIAAPWIAPYSPLKTDLGNTLAYPSAQHWLGTDQFGRDIVSRLIWGSRISLQVALAVVVISLTLGTLIGAVAGFAGGWVDRVIVVCNDILLAFPGFLLALALVAARGSSLESVITAVSIAFTPRVAAVMRSVVLTIKPRLFVEASRAIGMSSWRILWRHIVPNALPPVIVVATVSAATAILAEAGLSFLGLGVQPPTADLGQHHLGRQCNDHDQSADLVLGRPLHRHRGRCAQSARRRLTRHARPADAAPDRQDDLRPMVTVTTPSNGASGSRAPRPAVLEIRGLVTRFPGEPNPATVVNDVSVSFVRGETLAVVGESGSGKTMTFVSAMGLVAHPGRVIAGEALLCRRRPAEAVAQRAAEAAAVPRSRWFSRIRCRASILSSGSAIRSSEAIRAHRPLSRAECARSAIRLLERVHIPDPRRRIDDYPAPALRRHAPARA